MKIGILNIHGSVSEHAKALKKLNVEPVFVKLPKDLDSISGLIIPGGESTTMGQLLEKFALDKAIKNFVLKGGAVWGSCAGAILLANQVAGGPVKGLGLLDIKIERNAYGRQLDSFETMVEFKKGKIPAVFIRAPKIIKLGAKVEELASYNNEVVAAQKENIFISTFHPELTDDLSFHQHFLDHCCLLA